VALVVAMFVAESGLETGPIALFLHPLGLDHKMWQLQEDALADGVRLLMPDLPGFGRSRLASGGLKDSVEACADRLRSLSSPAVVFGISYGGYIAAMLTAQYPELVAGLALSGVRRRVPRALAALQAAAFSLMPVSAASQGEVATNEERVAEKRHLIEASHELGQVDLAPVLERITRPTVVFAPSRDWFVRREVGQVAGSIRGARTVSIPGAGHLWPTSRPRPLTDAIRSLIPITS
jgi:pimeloyl-ACP methyl ester carboxylesterase